MRGFIAITLVAALVACGAEPREGGCGAKEIPQAQEPEQPEKKPAPSPGSSRGASPDASMAIAECDAFIKNEDVDTSVSGWKRSLSKPPMLDFSDDKTYYWNLETNHGDIKIKLMPKVAPMHVSSTIYLTRIGYYDDLIFHRVIPGFMAQGGRAIGGPGYSYDGEFAAGVKHNRPGLLSMAHAGPGTDGSQFFLTFKATPWLDNKHTLFGEVVEGMDTLEELEKRGTSGGTPTEKLELRKATITVE